MSEEKKPAAKPEKASKPGQPSRMQKILNWFKTLPQRIAKPFRNMYYELKKVSWPTKQKLISYSIIVLVFMLFMGVVVGLLDMGASAGVRAIVDARGDKSASQVVTTAAEPAEDETEEAADETAADAEQEAAADVEATAEPAADTEAAAEPAAEPAAEEATAEPAADTEAAAEPAAEPAADVEAAPEAEPAAAEEPTKEN